MNIRKLIIIFFTVICIYTSVTCVGNKAIFNSPTNNKFGEYNTINSSLVIDSIKMLYNNSLLNVNTLFIKDSDDNLHIQKIINMDNDKTIFILTIDSIIGKDTILVKYKLLDK